jgi:hypothetical protein
MLDGLIRWGLRAIVSLLIESVAYCLMIQQQQHQCINNNNKLRVTITLLTTLQQQKQHWRL